MSLPVERGDRLGAMSGVIHGITCRVPGLGRADGNVGLGRPRDPEDAWTMRQAWCAAIGVDAERLVAVRQVHGADVAVARRRDAGRGARPGSEPLASADGLVTAERGVALLTLHADCLPILLFDPEAPAVAVLHAGWRGTVGNIVGSGVAALASSVGTRPNRLLAYLAPAIRSCCYEVGDQVADAWRQLAGREAAVALEPFGSRWRLDVSAANRWLLERAGLDPENVEVSGICTRCNGDRWFSHRGQGPATGRFGAVIALTEN
jgi:YfiH family protein